MTWASSPKSSSRPTLHPTRSITSAARPPARDLAAVVKKYIPDAKITFGTRKMPPGMGLPWKVSMARAIADFGFQCMPIDEAVLIHINDARLEAGLPPIKAPAKKK